MNNTSASGTVLKPNRVPSELVTCHLQVCWWIAHAYNKDLHAIQAANCIHYDSRWHSVRDIMQHTPNTDTVGLYWDAAIKFPVVIVNSRGNGRPYVLLHSKRDATWHTREVPRECWQPFVRYMKLIDLYNSRNPGYSLSILREWNYIVDRHESLLWIADKLHMSAQFLEENCNSRWKIEYFPNCGDRQAAATDITLQRYNPSKQYDFMIVLYTSTYTHNPCMYVHYNSNKKNMVFEMDRTQVEHWNAFAWYMDSMLSRFRMPDKYSASKLILRWLEPTMLQAGPDQDEQKSEEPLLDANDPVSMWDTTNIRSRIGEWISMRFQRRIRLCQGLSDAYYESNVSTLQDAVTIAQTVAQSVTSGAYLVLIYNCTETRTPRVCLYMKETGRVTEVEVDQDSERYWDAFAIYMESIMVDPQEGHAYKLLASWQHAMNERVVSSDK
jgi:hypothetical protein